MRTLSDLCLTSASSQSRETRTFQVIFQAQRRPRTCPVTQLVKDQSWGLNSGCSNCFLGFHNTPRHKNSLPSLYLSKLRQEVTCPHSSWDCAPVSLLLLLTGQLPSPVTLPRPAPTPHPFLSYEPRPLSDSSALCSPSRLWMPSREPRTWPRRWGTRSDLILSCESGVKIQGWGLGLGRQPHWARSGPEPFVISRSRPSHPQHTAVSLPPTEHFGGQGKRSIAQRISEFLRGFMNAPNSGLHSLRAGHHRALQGPLGFTKYLGLIRNAKRLCAFNYQKQESKLILRESTQQVWSIKFLKIVGSPAGSRGKDHLPPPPPHSAWRETKAQRGQDVFPRSTSKAGTRPALDPMCADCPVALRRQEGSGTAAHSTDLVCPHGPS